MSLIKKLVIYAISIFFCSAVYAQEYVIHKIRISGLQRINKETVLSNLPVKEGDLIDSSQTVNIIRELYKTNFFSNVSLKRENNDLLISVIERETIGSISVQGNSKITQKQMSDLLKAVGLTEGKILDHAMLNEVVQELNRQYNSQGLYDVKISTSIKQLKYNRVAVTINIKEGPTAKIASIKIIGNKSFNRIMLLKEMSLGTTKPWSFFTQADRYSKEKLNADLEKLRFYYMDHGYINVKLGEPKVIITPDRKHIYITIYITEGLAYKIKGFSLEGDLIGKRAEILKLITIKKGDIFSRKNIIDIQSSIHQFLGDYGYGMSDIRVEPVIDDNNKTIFVKFTVDAGRRIYVRRINFSGNTKTHDEVLRREMRQYESSLFSLAKVNESRRRLSNLGYLQDVDYKLTPVEDNPDMVDLTYSVKEVSAITASLQGGYSDDEGFLYAANINDQNVLGTGKTVGIGFNNSKATQFYSLGYTDPYFTADNISLSLDGYFQKEDQSKRREISSYLADTYGILASFGIPLSDYQRAILGVGAEQIKIKTNLDTPKHIKDFVGKYGSLFDQFKVIAGWNYANFDTVPFSTKGFSQGVNLEVYGPLKSNGLEFYKIHYNASWYQPLISDFIFHARAEAGYGDSFGKTKDLPFFKNFFAGGINSVHGFDAGTLGDKDEFNHAKGGNIVTTASASIIVPTPLKDTVRTSVFFDIGNTYNNKFKPNELRSSYGVQVEWRTPLMPIIFSYAIPLHYYKDRDSNILNRFQFTIAFST